MVGENKFGRVDINGATEIEITHPNVFLQAN